MPRKPAIKTKTKKTPSKAITKKSASSKKNSNNKEVRILINSPELGSSGLSAQSGFISEAYTAVLQWPSTYAIYNKMRRSTPEIVMVRNAYSTWARGLSLNITLPEKPTDDDKRYQEFIYSVFDDMEGGLDTFMDTLVSHVPFLGWGWWEVVAGRRNPEWKPPKVRQTKASKEGISYEDPWRSENDDDLIGIRRLAWRSPGTFSEWEMDEYTKRLHGMWQEDYPNPKVLLPLKDSLHITFGDANNPEGLSPLEAVYRLERIHYGLSVIMGIGYEHAAGYLNVKKTETGSLSSDDKSLVKQAAMAIMTAQEGNYALWPYGLDGEIRDIGFAAGGSLISSMQHYSTLMLSVYNMQWMALNTMTGTGSFAMANDSSSMSVMSYNAMMEGFAEQLDKQVGRKLWEWNKLSFPNVTKRPKIGITKVDKSVALSDMSSFVSAMRDVLPLSEDDIKSIRKRSGFLSEVIPTKEELVKQAEEKAEITQASQPKQEDNTDTSSWDWGGQDNNSYQEEDDTELSVSAEDALNTIAKRYHELHYGGADGKQPHPDGSPQSVHGNRRARRGSTANPRAKSRAQRMEIIKRHFMNMARGTGLVSIFALEREVTRARGIDTVEFREALFGLVRQQDAVIERRSMGRAALTEAGRRAMPTEPYVLPGADGVPAPTISGGQRSTPTPAPVSVTQKARPVQPAEPEIVMMPQGEYEKLLEKEREAKELASAVTVKIKQELNGKKAFGAQFNTKGGVPRSVIEKKLLTENKINNWNTHFKDAYSTDLATTVSFFNYVDPETGLTSAVTSVDIGTETLEIKGKILSVGKEAVGSFTRTINRDGSMYNNFFTLNREYQGNSFGKRFYENIEENMMLAGLKKITISANIDVGLYAWARMGFHTRNEDDWNMFRSRAKSRWKQTYLEAKRAGYTLGYIDFPPVTKMFELAALSAPWDGKYAFQKSKSKRFGQDFLLSSHSWSATKTLDINDTGFISGQLYYESSK